MTGSRRARAVASLSILLAPLVACDGGRPRAVVVRDPSYLLVRTIHLERDATHTVPVQLPASGGGFGFASSAPLFDLNAFDLAHAEFAGGRTSVVGEAALWVPLKPEQRPLLAQWLAHDGGDVLGVFVDGRLVAAPHVKDAIGGIFVPVHGKTEGDAVLARLRRGGAPG